MTPAGQFRQRVTLQQPSGTRDAYAQRVTAWIDVGAVRPAKVEPVSVREFFAGAQLQAGITHRVVIRYASEIAAIDASWRLLYGTRVLVLVGPPRNVDEADREFELLCSEGLRDE